MTIVVNKESGAPVNWHEKHQASLSVADRAADAVARIMGSWAFIGWVTVFIACWIGGNVLGVIYHWDAYPFILLNLMFSMQATYATPIILMSQNRAADRDKAAAEHEWQHQDQALAENTKLTQEIHEIVKLLHQRQGGN
jgi:uncharacterized membrane protein